MCECFSDLAVSFRTDAEKECTFLTTQVKNVCYSLKIVICEFYAFLCVS